MIRILTARIFLRLACLALGVPVPVYECRTDSFRIRSMLIRALLTVNGFKACVLADRSVGYTRGIPKVDEQRGPVKYALGQIIADMPESF